MNASTIIPSHPLGDSRHHHVRLAHDTTTTSLEEEPLEISVRVLSHNCHSAQVQLLCHCQRRDDDEGDGDDESSCTGRLVKKLLTVRPLSLTSSTTTTRYRLCLEDEPLDGGHGQVEQGGSTTGPIVVVGVWNLVIAHEYASDVNTRHCFDTESTVCRLCYPIDGGETIWLSLKPPRQQQPLVGGGRVLLPVLHLSTSSINSLGLNALWKLDCCVAMPRATAWQKATIAIKDVGGCGCGTGLDFFRQFFLSSTPWFASS